MRVTVLVPTYRRPRDLTRCLRAIATQTRAADEVVVVARRGQAPFAARLASLINLVIAGSALSDPQGGALIPSQDRVWRRA